MHEVGHSLGLRHNFKASTMLTQEQLNDTAITRSKGLVGSVMDYSPINIAPKGKKQGDYYSTTIGPYDYWAIEYAYKPVDGDEATELKKIAVRAPEHDLVYATDEDAFLNDDPYVNRFDLGADPCQFGKDRIALASELLKDLDGRVVKDGDSWARTRRAFGILIGQFGDGATLASQYVGGQSVSRDHKADKDARDPIVPVSGAKQRECLKFLADNILSDQAFQFSPTLLRRLGAERWMHWGNDSFNGPGIDISVLERILGIQKIVLGHCLSAGTLARIQNQQLQADSGTDPLRMEEVFRSLTDGIWSDLDKLPDQKDPKAAKIALSTVRRNLQREYLRRLGSMVLGDRSNPYSDMFSYIVIIGGGSSSVPADARAWRGCISRRSPGGSAWSWKPGAPASTTRPGPTSRRASTGSPRSWRPISTSRSPEPTARQAASSVRPAEASPGRGGNFLSQEAEHESPTTTVRTDRLCAGADRGRSLGRCAGDAQPASGPDRAAGQASR